MQKIFNAKLFWASEVLNLGGNSGHKKPLQDRTFWGQKPTLLKGFIRSKTYFVCSKVFSRAKICCPEKEFLVTRSDNDADVRDDRDNEDNYFLGDF